MFLKNILIHYLISLVTLPPIILFLLIMYIYREFAFFILKKIKNPLNITRLHSSDSFWRTAESLHENFVDIVFILNSKSENFEEIIQGVKKSVQENILNNSNAFPKLTSVRRKFMGYTYLLRTKVDVEELVHVINAEEQQSLVKVLGNYVNNNKNENFLWELVIVKATSVWKNQNSLTENQVPIFLRVNHMVGDGLAVTNLMVQCFDGKNVAVEETLKNRFKKNYNQKGLIKRILETINLILTTPGYCIDLFVNRRANVWETPFIEKERRYFFAVEPNDGMVNLVKSIKNQLNAGFTDIMLTSIAASLQSYLKKLPEVPEYSLMALVYFGKTLSTLYKSDGTPNLQNQFAYVLFHIPISGKDVTLLERLKLIKEERKAVEASPQRSVVDLILNKLSGLLPDSFIPYLVNLDKVSTCFSNLPGVEKMTMWNGDIDKIFFFPPHLHQLGMNFSLITVNNKLHVGLVVDKAVKASDDICQNLVTRVLDNIIQLKEELLNKNV